MTGQTGQQFENKINRSLRGGGGDSSYWKNKENALGEKDDKAKTKDWSMHKGRERN